MKRGLIGALCFSVTVALLAGCGGSQPPVATPGAVPQNRASGQHPGQGKSWMSPGATKLSSQPWLYVDDSTGNAVYVYALSKKGASQIGEITDGLDKPFSSTVDSTGNLYVVNRSIPGSVAIYAPGATSPDLVLTQDLTYPQSVAVDTSGNVWVTNRSNSQPGIAVFPPGETTPSAYITGNLIRYPLEDTFDSQGNLYFADADTGVSKIANGSQHPISLGLKGLRHHSAVGLALSPSGKLYVDNYNPKSNNVYTTRVYKVGNIKEQYALNGHIASYNMAAGDVSGKAYIFAPDWYSGDISVYRDGQRTAFEVITTPSQNTGGVAYKPAGVP